MAVAAASGSGASHRGPLWRRPEQRERGVAWRAGAVKRQARGPEERRKGVNGARRGRLKEGEGRKGKEERKRKGKKKKEGRKRKKKRK
jgi:hypothetical protein